MSDTKTAISASLVAIISHYMINFVSTGNRHLDNQINTLITMLTSLFIGILFVFPSYFTNCVRFYKYYSHGYNPYYIDGDVNITKEEFEKIKNVFRINDTQHCLVFNKYLNDIRYIYETDTQSYDISICSESFISNGIEQYFINENRRNGNPTKAYRGGFNEYVYIVTTFVKNEYKMEIRCENDKLYKKFVRIVIDVLNEKNEKFKYDGNYFKQEYNQNKIIYPRITVSSTATRIIDNITLVSRKKTFHNLFFKDKPKLIKILDKFQRSCMYPDTVSMENKLGILLYGPPGTGKTGTISAISNYLDRDIVMIDLTSIRFRGELNNILKKNNFEFKKHIFVLEEIDVILDVIKNRKLKNGIDEDKSDKKENARTRNSKNNNDNDNTEENDEKNQPLDLAYLLQLFDGVDSNEDRIMIMTTNYPEDIDEALLRPGRIDLKLKLGNCNHSMIRDIIARYYKLSEFDVSRVQNIMEDVYTPSFVINCCVNHEYVEDVISQLESQQPVGF